MKKLEAILRMYEVVNFVSYEFNKKNKHGKIYYEFVFNFDEKYNCNFRICIFKSVLYQ